MSDSVDTECEIAPDAQAEEQTVEKTPMPLRAKICLAVGGLVLLAGVLVGFGIADLYFSLWTPHPGWSGLITAAIIVGAGLFFEQTRSTAGKILLLGIFVFVLFWMAAFSGYGWYVFFTTGLDIESKFPLIVSKPGGALILAGIVMLIVCCCIHFMDGESFWCRVWAGLAWSIMATAPVLYVLTMISAPMLTQVATRELTSEEISTLKSCEVPEGSTKVRCLLPEAAKQGAAR